jgi:hypothetical protein
LLRFKAILSRSAIGGAEWGSNLGMALSKLESGVSMGSLSAAFCRRRPDTLAPGWGLINNYANVFRGCRGAVAVAQFAGS